MNYLDEKKNRLFFLVSGIHLAYQRQADSALKEVGLTVAQYGILKTAAFQEGMYQAQIAEAYQTDRTNVMVICDSLEKKAMITRQADPDDRRKNRIFVTTAGRQTLQSADRIIAKLAAPVFELLTEDKLKESLPLLEEVYASLKI